MTQMKWGNWTLHADGYLEHPVGRDIELVDCRTPAGMLDVIFQIRSKLWATPDDLANLLAAFVDVFDPQRTLCTFGQAKILSSEDVDQLVETAPYRRKLLDEFETGKFEDL